MSEIYSKIGEQTYSNLLADPQGADVIAVNLTPGKGTLTIGTVLFRESTGLYSPAASANVVNTNQLAVLNETVDSGEAPKSGETVTAAEAAAYRAGVFIDGAVTLAAGAALTDAHKVILRQQNIVFDKKEDTTTFTNTVTAS